MITEKDLLLEYLKDTGNVPSKSKYIEVDYDHMTEDRNIEVTCPNCKEEFNEDVFGQDEDGTTDVNVDCIDEDFHNWVLEKLLEYKNKDYDRK